MYKSILLFITIACCSLNIALSQSNNLQIGQWKAYLGPNQNIQSEVKGDMLYTITQGGLFTYNMENKEYKTFSTVNGLSGVLPTVLYQHPKNNYFYLGYADGTIDYFSELENITSNTDITRNSFYTQKTIYAFAANNDALYVATDFGLAVYSLPNMQPRFSVTKIANNPVRTPIVSVAYFEDNIWIGLEGKGLYKAPANNPNLSDPTIWQPVLPTPDLANKTPLLMDANDSNFYIVYQNSTIMRKPKNQSWLQISSLPISG
jgi:hypothetical protein